MYPDNCPCRLCKHFIPDLGFATLYEEMLFLRSPNSRFLNMVVCHLTHLTLYFIMNWGVIHSCCCGYFRIIFLIFAFFYIVNFILYFYSIFLY